MSEPTLRNTEWNTFILENGGGFLQSEEWARFQESLGRKVWRMTESVEGEVVARGTFVRLPLPMGRTYLYAPRGPVVAKKGNGEAFPLRFDTALAAMLEEARRGGDAFVRIEPEWDVIDAPMASGALIDRGFRAAPHVQPDVTSVIDLAKSEEELLAAMHQKTRYNIRIAEREGVQVRMATPESLAADIETFLGLMRLTSDRDGFSAHEDDYYKKQLSVLAPSEEGGLGVRLWIAELAGKPAAAAIVAEFGAAVTYLHGASDAVLRKHMAPYALHWEIMRDAKRHGFATYDFWGIAPTDDDKHPWAGMTRFKKGFGGRTVAYVGAWELPGKGIWYTLYRTAKAARRLLRR